MKNFRKIIAVLLTTAMVMALTPPNVFVHTANAADDLTRVAWVRDLVKLFGMTVEDDNMPDDYYFDIAPGSEHYRDVMTATEFGIIDLEAGLSFRPEDPVTREFAAQTMNFCLGFVPDEDSPNPFADNEDITYPDDVFIAVERQ